MEWEVICEAGKAILWILAVAALIKYLLPFESEE